jgi:hypothetical protein
MTDETVYGTGNSGNGELGIGTTTTTRKTTLVSMLLQDNTPVTNVLSLSEYKNYLTTCFKKGSKILTNKGYKLVEDLRKGDLIKTLKNEYLPIVLIGKSFIYNSGNKNRLKDKLYIYSKNNYPELFEDLVVTGGHSILVDKLSESQVNESFKYRKKVTLTEGKNKLLTLINELAEPYSEVCIFSIDINFH